MSKTTIPVPSAFDTAAAESDKVSVRLAKYERQAAFAKPRALLESRLTTLLAEHGITLPPVDPDTGLIDVAALEVAIAKLPDGREVHAKHRASIKAMLADSGMI